MLVLIGAKEIDSSEDPKTVLQWVEMDYLNALNYLDMLYDIDASKGKIMRVEMASFTAYPNASLEWQSVEKAADDMAKNLSKQK